jgi:acyl-CoA synthetase (AMP-forming)/AMP-acid ligase II
MPTMSPAEMFPAGSLPQAHRGLDLSGRWTPRLPADLIEHFATTIPGEPAITFIDYLADRSGPRRHYRWGEWGRWTKAVAHQIQQVAGRLDRVAILAPQGPEYIVAFHAALRAGVVAVPLFQPDLPGHGDRLELVFDDCRPSAVITTSDKLELVEKMLASRGLTGQVPIILPEQVEGDLGAEAAEAFVPPADLALHDLAYLQYTSGSTRAPAGVELTHLNLVYNIVQIIQAHGLGGMVPDVTGVSWLPLFHDMGLLLGAAATAVVGVHAVVMDPIAFILQPTRWVSELAGYRRTFSAAPNFAYALAAKKSKPEFLAGMDFSGVISLVNGAEPVLTSTIDTFEATFGPYGLPPTAQRPSYGLAEATLFVAVGDPANPRLVIDADVESLQRGVLRAAASSTTRSTPIVSPGRPFGVDVVITDVASGQPLPAGRVGEIWVNGPNVGRGYWQKPEETRETFGGTLAPEQASSLGVAMGPWLRTGDLGAMIGPDLFITGRHKDLIIVDGRNLYPHDIEHSVQYAHDSIALHRLAAFSVPASDGEGVVVVAEQYRQATGASGALAQIGAAARQRVSEEHSVALHDFVLIAPDTIPWTSSGKIARGATKEAYLVGTLTRVEPY